jgi:steroid delta-isomerase
VLYLPFAILLSMSACTHGGGAISPTPTSIRADDEARIRRRLAEWVEQMRSGDRVAAAEVWAPDLVGWYPGQEDDTYEKEQAQARRQRPPEAPRSIPAVRIEEVMVSGDLAVVRDIWRITRIAGGDTTEHSLRSFEVWQRQRDGAWRIARWISAPDLAPAQK